MSNSDRSARAGQDDSDHQPTGGSPDVDVREERSTGDQGDDSDGAGQGMRDRILAHCFGDSTGLALFLATFIVLGLTWRIGFFIVDSVTIANTLANVAVGTLEMKVAPFSLTFGFQPGLHEVGGQFYGRNYGQVLMAVPVLYALQFLATVADPSMILLAGWSFAVIGLGRALAAVFERPGLRHLTSGTVAALFILGTLETRALPVKQLPIVALQIVTILAVGVAVVAIYRLLRHLHGRRVGIVAGTALLLASPLTFWGTIPKRHAFTAAAIAVCLFWFATSRMPGPHSQTRRAGAYVVLGLFATVHAFEAAVLASVLLPVDILTAPANDRRSLTTVGGAFLLSLVPLFLINVIISGNPLKPPRLLPSVDSFEGSPDFGGSAGDGGIGGGGTADGEGPVSTLLEVTGDVLFVPMYILESIWSGLSTLAETGRMWSLFVRSGHVSGVEYARTGYEVVELSVLESFPLLGAVVWYGVQSARRLRARSTNATVAGRTDLLAGLWCVIFVLVYLPYLPLHSQITVRYLAPLAPLGIYAVGRLAPVRDAIRTAPGWVASGFAATSIVSAAGMVLVIRGLDLAVGEAVQLHGLLALGAVVLLGGTLLARARIQAQRAIATALAMAGGVTASFLFLSAFVYFGYGRYAIPPARLLAEFLPSL